MQSFLAILSRVFDRASLLRQTLAQRWQKHANRRSLIALILVGFLGGYAYAALIRPPEDFPTGLLVTIEQGASLSDAAATLEAMRVVRSATALKLLMKVTGAEGKVHAGDYLFKQPRSLFSIARAVSLGAYGLEPERFRVVEGAMTKEMADLFSHLQRFDEERFLRNAQPLEGFLFPDTYFFLPNATDELILQTMRQNFDARTAEIQPLIDASGRSLEDLVIMASLVEREARNSEDRRRIAGVLWNRIDRGMLLQVDAAFLYTLGKGSFDLTVADLADDDPYNTYKRKGLPPTAIGSPSLDSLRAAADPIKSNYLFYLADRNGVTYYSKTYEEHLRKKRLYLGS
ncbi:MAG: endolytic transglycosylase MltG [Candidatus Kaiserbacteria bacterium]|nr:MAG: endolytic transglycosylase MltG [Candidatus Kaiserbacteria bacterium]